MNFNDFVKVFPHLLYSMSKRGTAQQKFGQEIGEIGSKNNKNNKKFQQYFIYNT